MIYNVPEVNPKYKGDLKFGDLVKVKKHTIIGAEENEFKTLYFVCLNASNQLVCCKNDPHHISKIEPLELYDIWFEDDPDPIRFETIINGIKHYAIFSISEIEEWPIEEDG